MRNVHARWAWPGILFVFVCLLSGCATYYQRNLAFQEAFYEGNFKRAEKLLDKNRKAATNRNRLLFFLQKGVVLQMQGAYAESNQYLEQAYYFTQDYRTHYLRKAASLLTNPSVTAYRGEDHEVVLLHYYKAMNYLMLREPDKALVEIRRIDIKLRALELKYEGSHYRYTRDAFLQNLMGLAYEANGEMNDAFIAYRNSYESYENLYAVEYGVACPEQLKKDLVRSAGKLGFVEEQQYYEQKTGYRYKELQHHKPEVLFFWQNGLGPVKAEWSINFAVVHGENGVVTFQNEDMGLSFPFPAASSGNGQSDLGDLKVVRVAFPKYVERPPFFTKAEVVLKDKRYPLEEGEDINAIAFKSLEDRALREWGTSLMRLAIKQSITAQTRKENEELGAAMSILNALTEKADTRNWQTLPHSIYYARIPLEEGKNELVLQMSGKEGTEEAGFTFTAKPGQPLQFHIYSTMDSVFL